MKLNQNRSISGSITKKISLIKKETTASLLKRHRTGPILTTVREAENYARRNEATYRRRHCGQRLKVLYSCDCVLWRHSKDGYK